MGRHLIYLQWKQFWRSRRMGTTLATRGVMIFMTLYFSLLFIALGFVFNDMAAELHPEMEPIQLFNKYVLLYLIGDLIIRVMFQEVTDVKFRQLSLLPISKSGIVNYVLRTTMFSAFNLMPLLILIPVLIRTAIPAYGLGVGLVWLLAILAFLQFNNFLSLRLKQFVAKSPINYFAIAGIGSAIIFLDNQGYLPLSDYFSQFMESVVYAIPLLVAISLAFGAYMLIFKQMRGQAYVTSGSTEKLALLERVDVSNIGGESFFGNVLQLNIQHVFRNKRLRTQFMMGLLMLCFGGFLLSMEAYSAPPWKIFWGFYLTGILPMTMAQYMWSYQASYYELLQTMPFSMKKYINAQYSVYWIASAITALPAMLYYFLDPALPKYFAACFLYVLGLLIPFLMLASCYNRRKMDISTSGSFNMQGVSGQQFVFIFGVLLAPIFIFLPFYVWQKIDMGLIVLGALGLVGILCRPLFLNLIVSTSKEKKYLLTEGFRSN